MNARSAEPGEVRTTCPYCGVGCGVLAKPGPDGSVSVRGDPDHPANFGRLCSKGSALGETLGVEDRLLHPEIGGRRASWAEALDLVASTFGRTVAEHGPDSVAFYVSGQLLTEDYYVANKLMKGFIGSANIDTNSRLCMSSSVAGHRRAFGTDTVPGTYEDFEEADLVVLTGSNLAWCHPVLYQRLADAKERRPGMKVVTVDPRRTMTAEIADMHLAVRPDGDGALFVGLLAFLAKANALDRAYIDAHTSGFDEALEIAEGISIAETARRTGIEEGALLAFYRLFATTERVVTVYSQGVNQSSRGTDKVNAIINCHLATGRIGRPGMGPFSVTGQPNAMGGREVGGLANMLAAHMAIESEPDRDRVRRFWRSPAIASRPGLKAVDMFRAVADGRIKAIWIMATNPAASLPEADKVEAALAACPFVVVSDIVAETDTIRHAHVKLPAGGWGEKDGTVTNSERRVSAQRAFMTLPGKARPDWWIIAEVARRMGFADAFHYDGPAEIFAEHAALSAFENAGRRDFDIGAFAAISRDDYGRLDPFQWPQRAGEERHETRFFAEGGFYREGGRALFVPVLPERDERVVDDLPMVLNTGRVRDHWHTMTRTGKSERLSRHLAEPFAELHPADADRLGIGDADIVRISTAHGEVLVRALLSRRQAAGAVFVPIHWTDQFAAKARVDALVPATTDPVSGQPALKHVAAKVERFAAAMHGFAILAEKPGHLDADYWCLARAAGGWRVELAFADGERDWIAFLVALAGGRTDVETIGFRDAAAGRLRFASFAGDRLVAALFLSPEPVAVPRSWAADLLGGDYADRRARLAVLAGRPGGGVPDRGAIVCTCFSVGASQIVAAIGAGCRSVAEVGAALQAGTNCGSCRAEIASLIEVQRPQAAE